MMVSSRDESGEIMKIVASLTRTRRGCRGAKPLGEGAARPSPEARSSQGAT
jgi:hypothetical protein